MKTTRNILSIVIAAGAPGVALLALSNLIAADTPDIGAEVAAARRAAEDQLAAQRIIIADQRSVLMAAVQESHRHTETQRERLHAALRERDTQLAELKKRKQEAERELTLVRALVDRAVVASGMGDKQAKSLTKAPPAERLSAAIGAINERIAKLPELLATRLSNESIIARDGSVITAPVLHLGAARAIALGSDANLRGLLARAGDGTSLMVVGPPVPAQSNADAALPALVPLDPDGTADQLKPLHTRSIAQWIKAGRFFIWPIMILFAIGLIVAVSRVVALLHLRVDPQRMLIVADLLHRGRQTEAEQIIAAKATPLDRVLAAGIAARGRPREQREAVLEQALIAETPRFNKGLAMILVLAGVAPLLGLLGTVTGMIDMFGVIAEQGSGNAKSLSGAISEALIVTQAGMMAAIPLLLIHAALSRVVERRLLLLDEAACGLLGLAEHGDQPVVGAVR